MQRGVLLNGECQYLSIEIFEQRVGFSCVFFAQLSHILMCMCVYVSVRNLVYVCMCTGLSEGQTENCMDPLTHSHAYMVCVYVYEPEQRTNKEMHGPTHSLTCIYACVYTDR